MFLVVVLPLLFLLIFVPVLTLLYGITRWQSKSAERRRRLEATRGQIQVRRFDAEQLGGLPLPVQRYFQAVLTPGQPIVAVAEIEQTGEMRLRLERERWTPFSADQVSQTERPGFDWDARIRQLPGGHVFVHDSYIEGKGSLKAALFALVPVAGVRDREDLARAELMRFLAEAPWYPTKLLPSQGVRWSGIDDSSAAATLADGALEATVVFGFDDDGLIHSARAEARARMEGKTLTETPWECRFWGYGARTGMRIPHEAEAAWILPGARQPYWRGRVKEALNKFAP